MEKLKTSKMLLLLVIVLTVNLALTVINVYLTIQFNQTLANLRLQDKVPESVFTVTVKADDVDLGRPTTFFVEGGVLKQTIHHGTLHALVYAMMPHYGVVTIKLKFFNVSESKYLSPERLNETEISYINGEEDYVYVLAPGFNQINAYIKLKAKVPLNPANLPSKDETVRFSLGRLFLEVEAFDFETKAKLTRDFSSEIFVTIEKLDQW